MTMSSFLFGNVGGPNTNAGLEHILLEAKKFLFYDVREHRNLTANVQFQLFKHRVKYLIWLERKIAINTNRLEKFEQKWNLCETTFTDIFNPDPELE